MMQIWWPSEKSHKFQRQKSFTREFFMFAKKPLVDIIINLFRKFSFTPPPFLPQGMALILILQLGDKIYYNNLC